MAVDSRHRRTRTRDSSNALVASTSSLSLSSATSLHKRTTSLGVAPYPGVSQNNAASASHSIKGHKRAHSTQTGHSSRARSVLGESISQLQNMPSIASPRRDAPAFYRTESDDVVQRRRNADPSAWTDDRQRGLELLLGLMGDGEGSGEEVKAIKPTKSTPAPSPKPWRKNKSTDATPLARPPMHRSRHSLGPGVPTPFSALSRCSSPLQASKTAKSTPSSKAVFKNRPPPLRDLPPPSWSCPGPSPPLTGLAQPFPNECWVIHVPSPINAVIASVISPPGTPERCGAEVQLRRRRSSLSSFESSTSTIRPPAWYTAAAAANELTPRPSRNQLLHEAQHDMLVDVPLATPSQRKRRHARDVRSGSVPVDEADEARARGRRRVRDGRGSVQARMDEWQGPMLSAIGGWMG